MSSITTSAIETPARRSVERTCDELAFLLLGTLLLLALCPTFYGHMFMNPKDAPFAVAMVILILGLVRLAEEYPQPSPRTILIVGFGAGLSIGCRVLGGLALVYAVAGFVPLLLEAYRTQGAREAARRFAHVVYALLPGLVFGYLVMGPASPRRL